MAKVSTTTTALPTVTSVKPGYGPLGGGTKVVVTGSGFMEAGIADVSSVSVTPVGGSSSLLAAAVTVSSTTRLTAVVPDASSLAGNAPMAVDVRVNADGLQGLVTPSDQYGYAVPTPTITNVVITGTVQTPKVTVTGTGFGVRPVGAPPCGKANDGLDFGSNGLWMQDTTNMFTAGQADDCVGLVIKTYTATKIVLTMGGYFRNRYTAFAKGDGYAFTLWGVTKTGTVV